MSREIYRKFWSKTLTRFELARVVGARAAQLSLGAPPLVDPKEVPSFDPVAIAIVELLRGVLPITIRRVLPDGSYELVSISDALTLRHRRYLESIIQSWSIDKVRWSNRLHR